MTTVYPGGVSGERLFMMLALALGMSGTGCASLSYENYGHVMDASGHLSASEQTPAGLVFSGEEATNMSTEYTGFIALDIENRSADWIRFQSITLSFGGPEKNRAVFVPMADDLWSFQRAIAQRNAVRRLNAEMALDAVVVSASLAAFAAGPKRPVGAAAAVAGAAAVGTSLAARMADRMEETTAPPTYPETHLLATPFAIPPGLFTKRWIVLSTPGRGRHPCIDAMLIDYTLEGGRRERVWLNFREDPNRETPNPSEWQADVCPSNGEQSSRVQQSPLPGEIPDQSMPHP